MTDYYIHAILPALRISTPLSCGPIVFCTSNHLDNFNIVPDRDKANLLTLLENSHDAFGRNLKCLGLQLLPTNTAEDLVREDLPRTARDALAISFISKGTALNCHHEQRTCVFEADYFDALPIRFRDNGFIIDRPGLLHFNTDLAHFRPALRVDISEPRETDFQLDESLLGALLKAVDAILAGRQQSELRQAFRALMIASNATRIVHDQEATYHDVGFRIITWVSAFETLVHLGTEEVGRDDVLTHIKKIAWFDDGADTIDQKSIAQEGFDVRKRSGELIGRENAACNFYRRLHGLRNDLAHGNAIVRSNFSASALVENGCRIDEVAVLLFRECLLEKLRDLGLMERIPAENQTHEQLGRCVHEHLASLAYHEAFAKALLARRDE